MNRSFGEVLREQAEVARQLAELPDDAFDERARLRRRGRELRGEAIALRSALPSQRRALQREKLDLERKLAGLDARADAAARRQSRQPGARASTADVDEAGQREGLVRRLREIDDMLEDIEALERLL